MPKINDLRELVDRTEVVDVVFHEVAAKRSVGATDDSLSMEIMARAGDEQIGVRLRAKVTGGGGEYEIDAEGIFALEAEADVEPGTLQEFIERVGVMVVYPYVREAVNDGAARLSLKRPVLKLLRTGDIKLGDA